MNRLTFKPATEPTNTYSICNLPPVSQPQRVRRPLRFWFWLPVPAEVNIPRERIRHLVRVPQKRVAGLPTQEVNDKEISQTTGTLGTGEIRFYRGSNRVLLIGGIQSPRCNLASGAPAAISQDFVGRFQSWLYPRLDVPLLPPALQSGWETEHEGTQFDWAVGRELLIQKSQR